MKAEFTIDDKRHTSDVVRHNSKTVFVIAPDGRIVKRDIEKHSVVIIEDE